jgi:Cu(I)/Ag(I) efflux system membrane protein CusA/SilA
VFKSFATFCVKEPMIILTVAVAVLLAGWYAKENVPIDAIPNIGQNQVIVLSNWSGRSPKDVEDQITYPLSIALLSVPGAESVRGKSLFGYSFVQVTFKDDIDFYWARSRVAEQLGTVTSILPDGVSPTLGPDATGLGQVFYYTLTPTPGSNLADLRSMQDYVVKYALQSVEGVSEVASIGGYVRQYQVEVDPDKLRFQNITLAQLNKAIQDANAEVGAKTVEQSGMEFIVRGKGFLGQGGRSQTIEDLENAVVTSRTGVPVRVKDLGYVQNGVSFRRGALDLNGAEAVGGVVVMRFGENPRKVIDGVKAKIKQLEPALNGVKINAVYDRTGLIDETIATLTTALVDEILITVIIIVLFLLHIRTSLIVALTLPAAVLIAFLAMRIFDLDANIMSLAGIAIAIGNMVDMGIVIAENIYQHLSNLYEKHIGKPVKQSVRIETIAGAVAEIAPALMTATATTVISFLPVFFLTGRDFKLFSPLAWTKTYALMASLLVSIVLLPVLCRYFLKPATDKKLPLRYTQAIATIVAAGIGYLIWAPASGSLPIVMAITLASGAVGYVAGSFIAKETLRPIEDNPVSMKILKTYNPLLRWSLNNRKIALGVPIVIFLIGLAAWQGIAPILWPVEKIVSAAGYDLNSSPTYTTVKKTLSGLKTDDWIALDEGSLFYMPTLLPSASFSKAMEVLQTQDTLIKDIPEVKDVLGKIGRAQSALDPAPGAMIETYITLKPKSEWREGITQKDIWDEINKRATFPGVTRASFLQPIEGRVVMLQSGIKAPMAVRIYGDDLEGLAEAAKAVANHLKLVPAVNAATVNPDIVLGKPYAEFEVDRQNAARYGMSVKAINDIIETSVGGKMVGQTVEGRERYSIRVRYLRELRDQIENLEQIPVVSPKGEVVPLGVLAKMKTTWGPAAISSEDARLVSHVAFAPSGIAGAIETVESVMSSLTNAQTRGELSLPPGYELQAVGSFQNQIEANKRLLWLVPMVMFANLFIIFLQFRKIGVSFLVFSGIPVAFGGGMILLGILGIEINTAIWVGFIALFGISVDNGVILASYLESVFRNKPAKSKEDIVNGVLEASARRVRPCLMTTATTIIALIPVIASTGRGADVARAMALPIFGGMFAALLGLIVVPVVYAMMKEHELSSNSENEPEWEPSPNLGPAVN